MTVAYVAQDRSDLQRTVRELAKGVSQPKQRRMLMLKRCARYFKHAPILVQSFRRQPKFDHWARTPIRITPLESRRQQ